jgi:hypothetical protein
LSQITQGAQKQYHFEVYIKCNRALVAYGETNDCLCICYMAEHHTQIEDITMAFRTVFVSQVTTFACILLIVYIDK